MAAMQIFWFITVAIIFTDLVTNGYSYAAYKKRSYVAYDSAKATFYLSNTYLKNWIAVGDFKNAIMENGWTFLNVTSQESSPDEWQAYAAGLVEGHLTQDLINLTRFNTRSNFCPKPYSRECSKLRGFLQTNLDWVAEKINTIKNNSYWHQVKLFMIQIAGLSDGYHNKPNVPTFQLDPFDMWLFQISEDLDSITQALNVPSLSKAYRYSAPRFLNAGACTALIKLLEDGSDVFVSHVTWSYYNTMLRVIKRYDLSYHTPMNSIIPGKIITLSSYPGVLFSMDDFHIMSTHMVSLETTTGNRNKELWKFVQPTGSILEPVRVMVANRLATSGHEWTEFFSQYNSGTYNNEWMIVDFKHFNPSARPSCSPGFFTVLDQLPGYIESSDLTDLLLKDKYFGSYNIPYFPKVFNMSGNLEMVAKYGNWLSHDGAPRARILKRDHTKVKDLISMIKLMRYNDYQHDPLSRCVCSPPYSGENAIAARSDLNPANGTYQLPMLGHRCHGATDMKVTNAAMVKDFEFIAQAGPTYDQQPPFQWSKAKFSETFHHEGMPDLFKFTPIKVSW